MTMVSRIDGRARRWFFACCCLVSVTGCTAFPKLNAFGTEEVVERTFEEIDLAALLSAGTLHDKQNQVEEAFLYFARTYNEAPVAQAAARRNSIQERILAASEQRCGRYKRFLKQYEGESNFLLGGLATALAGAGALVSPVTAARALSGSAGVTSGVNAEFNDKLFAKLSVQVLTKAIDSRRKTIYDDIIKKRALKPNATQDATGKDTLAEYPVEAAVKDALTYHAACNLIVGLEEAAASIERQQNVGLKQLNDLQDQFKNLNLQLSITSKRTSQ